MRTLARAVRTLDKGGSALPIPFQTWNNAQISIRRGEVSMVAGPPGAGKSTVALAIALRSQVPTLYVSADTTEATMALRSLAMITGLPQHEVETHMTDNPVWASETLRQYTSHISWMFDASPTLADLQDELDCYRLVQGSDPQLLVIDNAVDITHETGDEFSSLRSLMREMKFFSRDTGAATIVLHHTSEAVPGDPCPPRSALHGKIAQVPSLILTLGIPQPGFMTVAAVKNRYGAADISGKTAIFMEFHPESMTLKDYMP